MCFETDCLLCCVKIDQVVDQSPVDMIGGSNRCEIIFFVLAYTMCTYIRSDPTGYYGKKVEGHMSRSNNL